MFAQEKKRDLGLLAAVAAIGLYAVTGSAFVSRTLVEAKVAPSAPTSVESTQLFAQR